MISPKELRLIAKMLEDFHEQHLSPAGCNDTPKEWLEEFSESEIVLMGKEIAKITELDSDVVLDYEYVELMRHKLLEQAELMEAS